MSGASSGDGVNMFTPSTIPFISVVETNKEIFQDNSTIIKEVSTEGIDAWLNKRPSTDAKPLPDVAKDIAQWIADGTWQQHHQLGKALWQQ